MGSWLEGVPSSEDYWPGRAMGRPASGPASIARPARRLAALAIDWALSSLLAYAFFDGNQWAILGIFAALQMVLVAVFGHSIGHRLLRMQVQTVGGLPAGPLPAVVRTVLICLVIPPLLVDKDQRGLHDRAMGTVLVNF